MARRGCLLLQDSASCKLLALGSGVGSTHAIEESDPEAIAEAVFRFVQQEKLPSHQLILAVDAGQVLTGEFELGADQRRRRRAMAYQFESCLPWAAEAFVSDYVADGGHYFGAAVEVDALLPLVTALENRGLRFQSISPAAILALQAFVRQRDTSNWDLILWQENSVCELFRISQGHLQKWCRVVPEAAALRRHLIAELLESPAQLNVLTVNAAADLQAELEQWESMTVEAMEGKSISQAARDGSELVLSGQEAAWIELRRDELAAGDPLRPIQRELRWLAAAALLLCLTVLVASWQRTNRNLRRIDQLEARQQELFRATFPTSRIPAAIVRRMESEKTKIAGAHIGSQGLVLPTPAINLLAPLLRGLEDAELKAIREIGIDNGSLTVDAEAESHAHVNELVTALREHGLDIDPPATTRVGDAIVETRLYGKLAPTRLGQPEER